MKKTLLKESLSQRISDILRLEIIENAIKEDEFFNETELATRFGVSRGPVREALRILETDCLVATQPNGRTKVLAITADDCRAHYDLRRFFENESIRRIIASSNEKDYSKWLDKMAYYLEQDRRCAMTNDVGGFFVYDNEFHKSFLTFANNRVYTRLWENENRIISGIMQANLNFLAHVQHVDLNDVTEKHQYILDGLVQRDLQKSLDALNNHLDFGLVTYLSILEDFRKINSTQSK